MKNKFLQFAILYSLFYLLQACSASKVPYYNSDNKDWSTRTLPEQSAITHSVFLIGETGGVEQPSEALKLMQRQAMEAGENSTVVYLGNQVYPTGVPDDDEPAYETTKKQLISEFQGLSSYDGNLYVLPGNKDWNNDKVGGRESVQRQEALVEQYFNGENVFQPDNGCGDPVEIDLNENMVMVIVNSQWWVSLDEDRDRNVGCEVTNELEFLEKLKDILNDNKEKHLIIAMHHPIYTSGKAGGYFPWKDHIFPLKKKWKKYLLSFAGDRFGASYVKKSRRGYTRYIQSKANGTQKSHRRSMSEL